VLCLPGHQVGFGLRVPPGLLIEQGIDPERPFKETIFVGSHDKVIGAVLFGPAAAGATYQGAVAMAKAQGFPTFDLEVLARTDPIPHDAIAVRVGLDDALVKGIQAALVELDRSPAGRQVIARSRKKLTGYAPATDSLYDVVRRAEKIGGR
jgi:ABC-type phosphate/phosphonate transport system substrate-binding protein